jgi:hypothetical protein
MDKTRTRDKKSGAFREAKCRRLDSNEIDVPGQP